MVPDVFKVVQHAHPIPRAVALVELSQSPARVPGTLVAEAGIRSSKCVTIPDDASRAVDQYPGSVFISASGAAVVLPQEGKADATVHAAGGYEAR